MNPEKYLDDCRAQFANQKGLAERAIAQITDKDFFTPLSKEDNSIAVIVKHIAGNMISRWKDFLDSDGEKADRNRDSEFLIDPEDSRAALEKRWQKGWQFFDTAMESLTTDDLDRNVYIRGEPNTVVEAINRQMTHCAHHVGQIVFLAHHFCGDSWQSLSIPKGKSDEFNRTMGKKKGT